VRATCESNLIVLCPFTSMHVACKAHLFIRPYILIRVKFVLGVLREIFEPLVPVTVWKYDVRFVQNLYAFCAHHRTHRFTHQSTWKKV